MDSRLAADLDRHITGNWGEDSVPPEPPDDPLSLPEMRAAFWHLRDLGLADEANDLVGQPDFPEDEDEITISLTRAQAAQLLATLEPNATGEVGAPQDIEIAYAVDTKVRLALGEPPLDPPDAADFGEGWKAEGPPIHPGLLDR